MADDATVVGDVTLGQDVSIWYGCVVRGDVASIEIGRCTNLQDLTMVHPEHDEDVTIGEGPLRRCRREGRPLLHGEVSKGNDLIEHRARISRATG